MASTDTLEKVSEIPASEIEYKEYCGSGSYGAVRCAVWKDRLVAVKIPHRNENDDEIRHLTVLNHSNIIKFFGIVKKDKKHSLVMEFSEIGSLSRILHERIDVEYSLSHVINWCLQTACGLAYLHSLKPRPMMHRDLKPQNILLFDDGKIVKLCDFGTLRRVDTQVTQERGSIAYMAPEVIKTQHYSEKCDVYSWGVLLWEMVTRERPYSDREFYQVYFAVCNGHRLQLPQKVHPIFLKLMTFSWDDKPEKRPDMKTVQEIMQQLFAIVVDENDPSRCTSLNIPNLNDKATDSNDENSVSDSCEMSQPEEQSRIDLKARQLQRMASTNSIITNINHCFFNQSEKPYISDCDAIELLEYDDLRALCHPRLIPEEHSLDSSESESSTKIYQDHIKEAKEYIRKYCELVVLRQDSQETISNPPKSAGDYIMLLREEKDNLEKERQSYYTKLHEMTLSSSEWVIIDSDDTA